MSCKRPTALHTALEETVQHKSAKLVNSTDCVRDSLSSDDTHNQSSYVATKGPEFTSKHIIADSRTKCPLSHITSRLYNQNGGVLTSEHGDLKLTIPEGAITDGDSVTLSLASDLYGPFVLPSKRQSDLVSLYYWIGVSGSCHFKKPIQVEFEHFGACDPSHYQLLCCEHDDESYTMQPEVDYDLEFTLQGNISLCLFQTQGFCSYCLYHNCKDPMINRIGAYYLIPENYQSLDHFSVEILFSLPMSHCSKRNKELYSRRRLMLHDGGYIFDATCSKNSKSCFFLEYEAINGWDIDHSLSKKIPTKNVNFFNYYTNSKDLQASEEDSLLPPRFIVNVVKSSECTTDLYTNITVSLYDDEGKLVDSTKFKLFVPISVLTPTSTSVGDCISKSPTIANHCCRNYRPQLVDLSKYKTNISNRWKEVALNLKIPEDKVSTIDADNPNVEDNCYHMFKTLDTTISACWCNLIQALCARDIGLHKVADEVKVHLKYSNTSEASPDTNHEIIDLHQLTKYLRRIPDSELNYFITCLLPTASATTLIQGIRLSQGSREERIKKVCEEFLKQDDPSWTKIHRALKEAECYDLAKIVEASFLPL